MRVIGPSACWLPTWRRYLVAVGVANLAWETGQMPLYTLGRTGAVREIAVAVLHCTAGDVAIAASMLVGALVAFGNSAWPAQGFFGVLAAAVVAGMGYTLYSEYLNTVMRASWSYTTAMPRLPWLGTGLSPLAQWLIVPTFSLLWARNGFIKIQTSEE